MDMLKGISKSQDGEGELKSKAEVPDESCLMAKKRHNISQAKVNFLLDENLKSKQRIVEVQLLLDQERFARVDLEEEMENLILLKNQAEKEYRRLSKSIAELELDNKYLEEQVAYLQRKVNVEAIAHKNRQTQTDRESINDHMNVQEVNHLRTQVETLKAERELMIDEQECLLTKLKSLSRNHNLAQNDISQLEEQLKLSEGINQETLGEKLNQRNDCLDSKACDDVVTRQTGRRKTLEGSRQIDILNASHEFKAKYLESTVSEVSSKPKLEQLMSMQLEKPPHHNEVVVWYPGLSPEDRRVSNEAVQPEGEFRTVFAGLNSREFSGTENQGSTLTRNCVFSVVRSEDAFREADLKQSIMQCDPVEGEQPLGAVVENPQTNGDIQTLNNIDSRAPLQGNELAYSNASAQYDNSPNACQWQISIAGGRKASGPQAEVEEDRRKLKRSKRRRRQSALEQTDRNLLYLHSELAKQCGKVALLKAQVKRYKNVITFLQQQLFNANQSASNSSEKEKSHDTVDELRMVQKILEDNALQSFDTEAEGEVMSMTAVSNEELKCGTNSRDLSWQHSLNLSPWLSSPQLQREGEHDSCKYRNMELSMRQIRAVENSPGFNSDKSSQKTMPSEQHSPSMERNSESSAGVLQRLRMRRTWKTGGKHNQDLFKTASLPSSDACNETQKQAVFAESLTASHETGHDFTSGTPDGPTAQLSSQWLTNTIPTRSNHSANSAWEFGKTSQAVDYATFESMENFSEVLKSNQRAISEIRLEIKRDDQGDLPEVFEVERSEKLNAADKNFSGVSPILPGFTCDEYSERTRSEQDAKIILELIAIAEASCNEVLRLRNIVEKYVYKGKVQRLKNRVDDSAGARHSETNSSQSKDYGQNHIYGHSDAAEHLEKHDNWIDCTLQRYIELPLSEQAYEKGLPLEDFRQTEQTAEAPLCPTSSIKKSTASKQPIKYTMEESSEHIPPEVNPQDDIDQQEFDFINSGRLPDSDHSSFAEMEGRQGITYPSVTLKTYDPIFADSCHSKRWRYRDLRGNIKCDKLVWSTWCRWRRSNLEQRETAEIPSEYDGSIEQFADGLACCENSKLVAEHQFVTSKETVHETQRPGALSNLKLIQHTARRAEESGKTRNHHITHIKSQVRQLPVLGMNKYNTIQINANQYEASAENLQGCTCGKGVRLHTKLTLLVARVASLKESFQQLRLEHLQEVQNFKLLYTSIGKKFSGFLQHLSYDFEVQSSLNKDLTRRMNEATKALTENEQLYKQELKLLANGLMRRAAFNRFVRLEESYSKSATRTSNDESSQNGNREMSLQSSILPRTNQLLNLSAKLEPATVLPKEANIRDDPCHNAKVCCSEHTRLFSAILANSNPTPYRLSTRNTSTTSASSSYFFNDIRNHFTHLCRFPYFSDSLVIRDNQQNLNLHLRDIETEIEVLEAEVVLLRQRMLSKSQSSAREFNSIRTECCMQSYQPRTQRITKECLDSAIAVAEAEAALQQGWLESIRLKSFQHNFELTRQRI